jgi:hypothetical protein
MDDLITIKKAGQPTLRISRAALDQHVKLGWQRVENEPVPMQRAIEEKLEKVIEDKPDTKLTLKK